MKKGKALRSVVLVGLSAVLVGGVAMAAAGCGGKRDANNIVVSMFSSNADKATNQKIADEWAAEYNAAHGTSFYATIANQESKDEYFNKLSDQFSKGTIGDVMYLAPRNVKVYAKSGRVIDLTPYIEKDETLQANIEQVWPNALNYYGLDTTMNAYSGDTYTMGQSILYNKDGAQGAGFYTEAGNKKVGIYGLPKDYSNFSMSYNRVYFSEAMKTAYKTTSVTQNRTVWAAQGDKGSNSTGKTDVAANTGKSDGTANVQYSSATGMFGSTPVISYAVNVTEAQSADGHAHNVGDAANIINPGIPVNILPFNFYMWPTFQDAMNAGDPIANMTAYYTGGKGYTVTIPGFPDEEFEITDETKQNKAAPYDYTKGHMVYTYAEYGALLWSLTYYLNTFAWDDGQNPLTTTANAPGKGGTKDSAGNFRTVYGGEQYEGGEQDGFQLYVLPWLYSNDADLIDVTNKKCTQDTTDLENASDAANWASHAGNSYDTVKKLRLNGDKEDVQVQYGLNSKNFIETFGAFLAIGSDWNGNPNDSPNAEKEGSGWLYVREGRSLFYGAGTWDSAVRNEEDKANVDIGQMATPVAEKFALYSYIKDANYNMTLYSNSNNDMNGKAGEIQTTRPTPTEVYSQAEINANLTCRQDKWGARMDSVGYAVTCMSLEGSRAGGAPTAKTEAAASLCAALTISEKPQVSLTYGGAQLPNFISQCKDLLHFQDEGYEQGTFKDMITPDGSATVKNTNSSNAGTQLWNAYYEIAKAMGDEANSRDSGGQTVAEYLSGKTVTVDGQTIQVKYDPDFANTQLNSVSFAAADKSAKSRYSFAMKVLRMVAFRKSDFDLLIRMQYGLNAVRDSSMYTYNDDWLDPHDARSQTENNLCYYRARSLLDRTGEGQGAAFGSEDYLKRTMKGGINVNQFVTPFVWCMAKASDAKINLEKAITDEVNALNNNGVLA